MENFESNMELTGSDPVVEETPTPETPSPEEPVKEETPADPAPEEPVKEESALYETPDGRKVDAATLQKEWKENFLPEFTRKSQRLAELDREKDIKSTLKDEPAWKNPDYVPQNYAEVIELAKKEAIAEMQNTVKAEQERIASIENSVNAEIAELKTIDPKLDENALFTHANKYGFQSLKTAHSNMMDMKKVAVDVEQRTVKNLKTRESDPISTVPGGEITTDNGYDPNEMSGFDSANDFLASLKGKK